MIRILISVTTMDRAGIETMIMNYYKHLDRTKFQFDFLCHRNQEGAFDQEILGMGGKIYKTPSLNPFLFFNYLKFMKNLFADHQEYQIIHVQNETTGLYALYAASKNNIPHRIFHAHSSKINYSLKWVLKMFFKSKILSYCNVNWACGVKAAKYYFGEKNVANNNFCVINNAIDLEKFIYNEKKRRKIRAAYNLENSFVVGHVGRFEKLKNHEFLIDIFQQILKLNKTAKLVLLGDGSLKPKIQAKVNRLNLEKAVLFLGNIENTDEWYQAFDAFLLPSQAEGLPVVGVEAQAASLPCFFSTAVTKEIMITDKAFFISLEDPTINIAKQIIETANDQKRINEYQIMTDKGYNIKQEAIVLQERYEKLLAETYKN